MKLKVVTKNELTVKSVDTNTYIYAYTNKGNIYLLLSTIQTGWFFTTINIPQNRGVRSYYSPTPQESIQLALDDGEEVYQYDYLKELVQEAKNE
jgi:hypothetical protein